MRKTIIYFTFITLFLELDKFNAYIPVLHQHNHPSPISKKLQSQNYVHTQNNVQAVTSLRMSKNDANEKTDNANELKYDNSSKDINDIVILGGGFGGLNTALYLASLPWENNDLSTPRIKLVDRKERFVFLPLLYELCVGDAEIEEVAPTFQSLLKDVPVDFIQADVQGIDAKDNKVYLKSNRSLSKIDSDSTGKECLQIPYDALVIATGMQSNLSIVPGASQFALPFYTVEDCYELRKRLTLLDKSIINDDRTLQAVVVGGGYSGVELALNLMERLGGKRKAKVILVHRGNTILEGASEFNRETSLSRLKKAGVKMVTDMSVDKIESYDSNCEEFDEYVKISNKYDSIVHLSVGE